MKHWKAALLLLTSLSILLALVAPAQEKPGIEGYWLGTLRVGGMELRIAFIIQVKADGALVTSLDSIDQSVKGIPVESVSFKDGRLSLECQSVKGKYEGLLNAETGAIEGTWTQPSGALPLSLKRLDKPLQINRPQEPKKPYPYDDEEVSYRNAKANITLGGTLTKPRSGAPHPAAILISGSGAQDRDETVFNHRPFLVLADHLTRLGLAVLRVDDRGIGKSQGNTGSSTTEDFAGDIEAGLAFLRSRPDINPAVIGLLGHSEGGLIAPLVASHDKDLAFIILLAGPGLVGEEILNLQGELIARASGVEENIIRQNAESMKKIYTAIKRSPDPAAAEKDIRAAADKIYLSMSEEQRKEVGDKETWLKALLLSVNNAWFRFFLTYDPRPALEKVRCPTLALFGEKDLQVPPQANLKSVEEALRRGGNSNFQVEILPGLNHLFQTANTGAPAEYGTIEETMSPAALNAISGWILKVITRTRPEARP